MLVLYERAKATVLSAKPDHPVANISKVKRKYSDLDQEESSEDEDGASHHSATLASLEQILEEYVSGEDSDYKVRYLAGGASVAAYLHSVEYNCRLNHGTWWGIKYSSLDINCVYKDVGTPERITKFFFFLIFQPQSDTSSDSLEYVSDESDLEKEVLCEEQEQAGTEIEKSDQESTNNKPGAEPSTETTVSKEPSSDASCSDNLEYTSVDSELDKEGLSDEQEQGTEIQKSEQESTNKPETEPSTEITESEEPSADNQGFQTATEQPTEEKNPKEVDLKSPFKVPKVKEGSKAESFEVIDLPN